jgi:hypothetical protein
MFDNTTIVDRRTTKQEVNNVTKTNVETSGTISISSNESRFITINKNKQAFKTVFSSNPFYLEVEQIQTSKGEYKRDELRRDISTSNWYKEITTKINVKVKQVLVVGSDYILEVEEISKEDVTDSWTSSSNKTRYFNTPTIL